MRDPSWWKRYFDLDFFELYRPFLPDEVTGQEVEGALELLGPAGGGRILDLACGWGRHSLGFARAGLEVVGLDLSEPLLSLARDASREASLSVRWVRADMRRLPFRERFDAVTSLFSSLGYFDAAEERGVLRGVRDVLKPAGAFLLETMHRDQVARDFVERDWWEGEDGTHVWVEREFDAVEGISHEWLRWRRGRKQGEKYHRIRIRSASEWDDLLQEAGLVPERWMGSWDLAPFEHTSERLIVLCRRGG